MDEVKLKLGIWFDLGFERFQFHIAFVTPFLLKRNNLRVKGASVFGVIFGRFYLIHY